MDHKSSQRAGPQCNQPRLGIGSYAFRYNIGFKEFEPPHGMGHIEFLETAKKLGVGGVQFCDNLSIIGNNSSLVTDIRDFMSRNDMFVEIGMRDISKENVLKNIVIAEDIGAKFIRIVLGTAKPSPETDSSNLKTRALEVLKGIVPVLEEKKMEVGIENHFDLPAQDLVEIIEQVGSDRVGFVFDTTNGTGFLEKPEQSLDLFLPHIKSIHIKDYIVQKAEAGYLIKGCVMGQGLLDYKAILSKALCRFPDASIIVEMIILRDSAMSAKQTVDWEIDQVEQSVEVLKEFLHEFVPAQ
jgi:sugar phosphate isomerase/epimerase